MNLARRLIERYFGDPATALVLVLGLGAAVRFQVSSSLDFPLNDGGFWYVFAHEIARAGFAIPEVLHFNGNQISATYPPLAAYLLASFEYFCRLPVLSLLVWLPFVISLITLGTFAVFSRALFGRSAAGYASMFAFALIPTSYRWFLMGGGVSRGLGLLFALTSWLFLLRNPRQKTPTSPLLGGLFAALAILSHPVGGLVAVLGGVTILCRVRATSRTAILWAAALILICLPWGISMITRYGYSPYSAAFFSGGQGLEGIATTLFSADSYGPLKSLNALAIAGMVTGSLAGGSFGVQLFLVMLVSCPAAILCDFGCVPLALLVGEGSASFWRGLQALVGPRRHLLWAATALATIIPLLESAQFARHISTQTLSAPEFGEIQRLDELFETPQNLLVLSQYFKAGDAIGEWIGSLSRHRSALSHQLREWAGDSKRRLTLQNTIEGCCSEPTIACAERVISIAQSVGSDTLLCVHRRSCRGLELEILKSGRYDSVSDGALALLKRK